MHSPSPVRPKLREPYHSIREVVADLGAPDLTMRQLVALAHLEACGEAGSKLRHVAESLSISKPAATRSLTRLVKLGFVVRHTTDKDARDSISRITSKGRIYAGLLIATPALRSAA